MVIVIVGSKLGFININIGLDTPKLSKEEQLLAKITKIFQEDGKQKAEDRGQKIEDEGQKINGPGSVLQDANILLITTYYTALRQHDFKTAASLDYDKTQETLTNLYKTLVDISIADLHQDASTIYSYSVIITNSNGTKTYRVQKEIVEGKLKTLSSVQVNNE